MPHFTFPMEFDTPDDIPYMDFKGVEGWSIGNHGAIVIDNVKQVTLTATHPITIQTGGNLIHLKPGDGLVIDTSPPSEDENADV